MQSCPSCTCGALAIGLPFSVLITKGLYDLRSCESCPLTMATRLAANLGHVDEANLIYF